jgi:hypothetical protein
MPFLSERKIRASSAVLITIPPFQRRASLTVNTHRPSMRCMNAPADWGDPAGWNPTDLARGAELCVGEIDRLRDYPTRGFIRFDPATLPADVIEAAELLRAWLAESRTL